MIISTLPRGIPSSEPVIVRVVAVDHNRISVSWEAGPFPNGPILSYVLQIRDLAPFGYSAIKVFKRTLLTFWIDFSQLSPSSALLYTFALILSKMLLIFCLLFVDCVYLCVYCFALVTNNIIIIELENIISLFRKMICRAQAFSVILIHAWSFSYQLIKWDWKCFNALSNLFYRIFQHRTIPIIIYSKN